MFVRGCILFASLIFAKANDWATTTISSSGRSPYFPPLTVEAPYALIPTCIVANRPGGLEPPCPKTHTTRLPFHEQAPKLTQKTIAKILLLNNFTTTTVPFVFRAFFKFIFKAVPEPRASVFPVPVSHRTRKSQHVTSHVPQGQNQCAAERHSFRASVAHTSAMSAPRWTLWSGRPTQRVTIWSSRHLCSRTFKSDRPDFCLTHFAETSDDRQELNFAHTPALIFAISNDASAFRTLNELCTKLDHLRNEPLDQPRPNRRRRGGSVGAATK